MTEWHVTVEAAQPALDDGQVDILHGALPGYVVLAHDADRGRLSLRFTLPAATLRQAADEALRTARHACGAAFSPAPELIQLRVLPGAEHVRELERPARQELLGYSEIAQLLGVSRQRARELAETNADFPPPLARLAAGPVYTRESVTAFCQRWPRRRTGRPAKAAAAAAREA